MNMSVLFITNNINDLYIAVYENILITPTNNIFLQSKNFYFLRNIIPENDH